VLLVLDALYRNGAVRVSLDLARRWSDDGCRIAVVQRLPPGDEVGVPHEVPVSWLSRRGSRLRSGGPAALARLCRATRRSDVVLNGSEIGGGLALAYLAARATRRPFVIAVHADVDAALEEWIPPPAHRWHHWLYRHADGAVCVAPGLVAPLVRHGVDPGRVRVVRNGVDLAAIRASARASAPQVAGPPALEGPTVVATGRLAAQKGIDLLLRAHAAVVTAYPHHVLLLNDGPEEEALRALARTLGVESSVHFVGPVPPLPVVARADLFCLPSRHEGLPLALLEAVALGVPCVAADCSDGVRAALDGGRVGDLVPVDDVAALAAALERHLRAPATLRAKAALGPDHAEGFDGSVMARQWLEALESLAAPAQLRRRRLTPRRRSSARPR
jgi:glycosyltransferase involved in cell wall biosynthesis